MDYEKKYNEALERARYVLHTVETAGCAMHKDLLTEIFPELRESEDERIRKNLISFLEALYAKGKSAYDGEQWSRSDCADWIAYLEKQEQKPAWSEEDEETIHLLIEILKVNHPNGKFKTTNAGTTDVKYISTEEIISRLESLRPSWKPSEEQMEVMKEAIAYFGKSWDDPKQSTLESLYEQLKKL